MLSIKITSKIEFEIVVCDKLFFQWRYLWRVLNINRKKKKTCSKEHQENMRWRYGTISTFLWNTCTSEDCNKCNCLTPGEGRDNLNFTTLTTELALGPGVFLDPKPSKGLMILKHSVMLIAWQNNIILPMQNEMNCRVMKKVSCLCLDGGTCITSQTSLEGKVKYCEKKNIRKLTQKVLNPSQ